MADSINFPTYGFVDDIFAFSEDNWRKYFKPFVYDSVQNGLAVTAGNGMTVNVSAGECRCGAVMGIISEASTLDIGKGHSSYARIDSVVAQYQYGSPSTLSLAIVQGTPAASPVAPTLQKNFDTLWQMEIAQIEVPVNATGSSQCTFTDKRVMVDISTITDEVNAVKSDVSALQGEVLSITTNLDTLNGEVEDIQSNIESITSDIANIDSEILSITSEMEEMNETIDSITTSIDGLDEKIEAITTDIETLEANVLAATTDIDTLEANVLAVTTDVADIHTEINSITTDVDALEASVLAITTDIDALEGQIDSITTNILSATTDIDALEGQVASITTEILAITTDIDGIDSHLETLDGQIDSITTDIAELETSKQDVLTFDNAPTENSNNPVKSGGVYSALELKADLESPEFTGVPTAPTAADGTNTTQIATTAFVQSAFKANDAMVFKGVVNSASDIPAEDYLTGWTYKVATAGSYLGHELEVGDMLIANKDYESGDVPAEVWDIIQVNIDGAVTGPTSATNNHVAAFDGNSGTLIKDSGYTIEKSVPADAEFTDTLYTGSDGIALDSNNNFTNTGVRAVASGSANGTVKVNTNGVEADVAVTGLKSAAYTETTDYATTSDIADLESAVLAITTDVETLESNVLSITTHLETVDSEILSLTTDVDGLKSEVASITSDIADLESEILSITTDIDTINGEIDSITSDIAELETSKQDVLTFDDAPTANSDNPVKSSGIKTAVDTAHDSLQALITDNIEEEMVATKNYSAGEFIVVGNSLYKVSTAIATDADLVVGTNVVKTTIVEQLMKSRFLTRY